MDDPKDIMTALALDDCIREASKWITRTAHKLGRQYPEQEFIRLKGASYRWSDYGGLRLYFSFEGDHGEIEAMHVTRSCVVDSESITKRLVHLVDAMIRDGLPGAEPRNRLTICSLPECKWALQGKAVFCRPLSKSKWVCADCEEEAQRFEDSKRKQRSAATPALRYKVLERDGFKCQACGRLAKEHGVVLRVDHIVAVANGGKTVMENLQALCDECNSGKSDSETPSL